MQFDWIPAYSDLLVYGAFQTMVLWAISVFFGTILAIGVALVLVIGPRWLARVASAYCTFMRGTPLLIQLWLLYYGVGAVLPEIPMIRQSIFWPVLREGFVFAAVAFVLNYAAYEAHIIRGALLSVPQGELEAARSLGMSTRIIIRLVWLPRALQLAFPTMVGEAISMLKSTPLAFTVTVMDLYAVAYKVRQDTFLVYEPLIVVTVFYVAMAGLILAAAKVMYPRHV